MLLELSDLFRPDAYQFTWLLYRIPLQDPTQQIVYSVIKGHTNAPPIVRFKGAVSEWDLRGFFCRQPRLQKKCLPGAKVGPVYPWGSESQVKGRAGLGRANSGFSEGTIYAAGLPAEGRSYRLKGSRGRAWPGTSLPPFLHGSRAYRLPLLLCTRHSIGQHAALNKSAPARCAGA